jgi:hypothetical protein
VLYITISAAIKGGYVNKPAGTPSVCLTALSLN